MSADGPIPDSPAGLKAADRHVHLIGANGIGMSALATLLIQSGKTVSGSDTADGPRLAALRELGARIAVGHDPDHLGDADIVVASPAVPRANAEIRHALEHGIAVVSRTQALVDLLDGHSVVSVAGSHGKTTTTAMLTLILEHAGYGPGFMIGGSTGQLPNGLSGGRWTAGGLFVSETCEAFGALDHWRPSHCVVTNIDDEHTNHYGSIDRLRHAFGRLVERVPANGIVALCGDDPGVRAIARPDRAITFGLDAANDLRGEIVRMQADGTAIRVWRTGIDCGTVTLKIPGIHNAVNALGAIAMATGLGIPFATCAAALGTFVGVAERWQSFGIAGGVAVFSDIAHHPTEIAAVLAAARGSVAVDGKLLAIVTPQLHSRVGRLAAEFAAALSATDTCLLLPVDPMGEADDFGKSSAALVQALDAHAVPFVPLDGPEEIPREAAWRAGPGDVAVLIGVRNAGTVARSLCSALESDEAPAIARPVSVAVGPTRPANAGMPLLHQYFERQVDLAPDAVCLEEGEAHWTYEKLEDAANRIARFLTRLGIGPDSLVALHAGRSAQLVATMLGVLKAGGAYVPLDPKMDRGPLPILLHGLGVRVVVTDTDFPAESWNGELVLDRQALWSAAMREDGTRPICPARPNDLAYAIFTSGTTGRPKLTGIEHRNIANTIAYSTVEILDADDVRCVGFIDSIGVDACVHQIFSVLAHGGTLVVERDLFSLLASDTAKRITNLGVAPSVLLGALAGTALPPSLRAIWLGGEVTPEALLARVRSVGKIVNLYGPTETAVYSASTRMLKGDAAGRIIGWPIYETTLSVVDERGRPLPIGETGEICISGAGVGRGYLGLPELTSARFRPDPYAGKPDTRRYLTGDRGRMRADGAIEFIGRTDTQFKLHGVRMEADEIERAIAACPGIIQAAAVLRDDGTARPHLAAFYTGTQDIALPTLRRFLVGKLPPPMIPTAIRRLEQLPLTALGKLDRPALADLNVPQAHIEQALTLPRNPTEQRLAAIWERILDIAPLGIDDDFFALGGDSLKSMEMMLAVEGAFGIRLEMGDAGESRTLGAFADLIVALSGRPDQSRQSSQHWQDEGLDDILRKQQMYLAAWQGGRRRTDSLIVSLNEAGDRMPLFWCCQGFGEVSALAAALGTAQPVFGMRSGHLVMTYSDANLDGIAGHYAQEMIALQPAGPFRLGGNCQGSYIAQAVAAKLRAAGRDVSLLLLMEQVKFPAYDGPVGLLFGRDSSINPYRRIPDPHGVFQSAYPGGFTVDMIDGGHGEFFSRRNVGTLASAIGRRLDETEPA